MSIDHQIAIAKGVLHVTPVKGKFGTWGVEIDDEPKEAYRYKRGVGKTRERVSPEEHSNKEQQRIALEALAAAGGHPFSARHGCRFGEAAAQPDPESSPGGPSTSASAVPGSGAAGARASAVPGSGAVVVRKRGRPSDEAEDARSESVAVARPGSGL